MAYDPDFYNNNKHLVDQGIGNQSQYNVDQNIGNQPQYNVNPESNPWGNNQVASQEGFPTYQVDPTGTIPGINNQVDPTGAIPGTNNTVVPTSNPWAQTQPVDPASNQWGGYQVAPEGGVPGTQNVVDPTSGIPGVNNQVAPATAIPIPERINTYDPASFGGFREDETSLLSAWDKKYPVASQEQIPYTSGGEPGGFNNGSLMQVANQGLGDIREMDIKSPLEKVDIDERVSLNQIDEQATPTNNLLAAASTDIDGVAAAAAKKEKMKKGMKSFGAGLSKAGQRVSEGGYEYDFLGDEDKDSIYG